MNERGILFSAPMVRKLLAGEKTQTRRVLASKNALPNEAGYRFVWAEDGHCGFLKEDSHGRSTFPIGRSPYGVRGDRLWVRETHAQFQVGGDPGCSVAYRATCREDGSFNYVAGDGSIMGLTVTKWTPAIHMPRWASRITLEITDVRVERLQDISGEDARAEGISLPRCSCEVCMRSSTMCPADASEHVLAFAQLWDSINGKRPGCAWDANPWVWALTFRRIEATP